MTFAVQQELEAQFERADQLRYKAVERAQYEAELAKRRYLRVDPDNRLVADSLEADWNEKLRALEHARQCYEQQRKREQLVLDENKREKLLALSTDFPKLWHDIDTPQRERKRMLRLLIEDVTLQRTDQILVHVRFRGGATKTLELGRPLPAWALRQTSTQVVAAVDALIAHHTDKEIAESLNERGMRSGEGRALHRLMVRRIRLASNGTTPIGCRSSFRKLLIQRSFSCDLGRCLSQAEAEFPGLAMQMFDLPNPGVLPRSTRSLVRRKADRATVSGRPCAPARVRSP